MYVKSTKKVKHSADYATGVTVGYLLACTTQAINSLAAQTGYEVSESDLAARLGELLRAEAGGGLLDGAERLPGLRGKAAPGHALATTAPEIHVRPRRKRTSTLRGKGKARGNRKGIPWTKTHRKRASKGAKSYWAGMTPEQRSAEVMRRQAVAAANKAA